MKKYIAAFIVITMLAACKGERGKMQDQIAELETKVIVDSSTMEFNPKVEQDIAKTCLAYADKFPEDEKAQEYLYKATSIYIGMKKSEDAIKLCERYIKQYPNGPQAAQCYFNIGYIYDDQLHHSDKAIAGYKAFIAKYPNHPLAKDATFRLMPLESGISDLDLVHKFMKGDTTAAKK